MCSAPVIATTTSSHSFVHIVHSRKHTSSHYLYHYKFILKKAAMSLEIDITPKDHQFVLDFYDVAFNKDVLTTYDKYASSYEKVLELNQYIAHIQVAKGLKACFGNDTASKLVLDVGCGTGLLGKELIELGFNNLHGLDASAPILEISKERKIYKKVHIDMVTTEPIRSIEKNTYDAVVSSGCFVPGHIKIAALVELARITKPGGFLVFSLNDPKNEMNYMVELGKVFMTNKLELVEMRLVLYKRECTKGYKQIFGYLITCRVL